MYLTQLEAFLYILEVKDFKQTKFSRTCVRNILLSADLFSIRQYVQSDNTCPTYGFRCVSSFPILFQYLVISFFNRLEFKFSCDRWNRKFRPRFEDFMIIIKASIFTACDQARGTNIKKRTTGRHTHNTISFCRLKIIWNIGYIWILVFSNQKMSKISQLSSCFLRSIFIQMLVFTFPDTAKNENFHFFASCPKNDMQSTLKKQIQYFFRNRSPSPKWAGRRFKTTALISTSVSEADSYTNLIFLILGLKQNPYFEIGVETLNSAASVKLCSVAVPTKGL